MTLNQKQNLDLPRGSENGNAPECTNIEVPAGFSNILRRDLSHFTSSLLSSTNSPSNILMDVMRMRLTPENKKEPAN